MSACLIRESPTGSKDCRVFHRAQHSKEPALHLFEGTSSENTDGEYLKLPDAKTNTFAPGPRGGIC